MVEELLFNDLLHPRTSNKLEELKRNANRITVDGFHIKPLRFEVNGKVVVEPMLAFKRDNLKAYISTDFDKNHKAYIEWSTTF